MTRASTNCLSPSIVIPTVNHCAVKAYQQQTALILLVTQVFFPMNSHNQAMLAKCESNPTYLEPQSGV